MFLEGIKEYVKTGNVRYVLELKDQEESFEFQEEEVDISSLKYQYCTEAFINMCSHLASHYDSVISINISDPLSGTYRNSQSAAQKVSAEMNKTISAIDSGTVSGAMGLLVMEAANMIKENKSHWDIVKSVEELKKRVDLFVSLKTMKNLVRSGRIRRQQEICRQIAENYWK